MKREKGEYLIQSIAHALDILGAFTPQEVELGVTEISRRLGLPKNNVFRILATLELRGYIEQNKTTGNYRLGLKTFELGQTFIHSTNTVRQARPVLEKIVEEVNETAYLGILKGTNAVYLDVVETRQAVRSASRLGAIIPACCTALGKAQLAFMPREELMRLFGRSKLVAYTSNTVATREELFRRLDAVYENGFALDEEEYEEGVRSVGAPVRDFSQEVVAGISISGPAYRITPERIQGQLVPLLKRAGLELSKRLGYEVGVKMEGVKV